MLSNGKVRIQETRKINLIMIKALVNGRLSKRIHIESLWNLLQNKIKKTNRTTLMIIKSIISRTKTRQEKEIIWMKKNRSSKTEQLGFKMSQNFHLKIKLLHREKTKKMTIGRNQSKDLYLPWLKKIKIWKNA